MRFVAGYVLLIASVSAVGQKPTGAASATGNCNIVISGTNNTVQTANALTGRCGIGKEQGDKIIQLLNDVLAKKDLVQINAKLDELISIAEKPVSQALTCVGSNCVQNGVQTNFDQRQFGVPQPPPPIIGVTQKYVAPIVSDPSKPAMSLEGPLQVNPGISVSFTVGAIFQNPMFLIKCDRPCSTTSAFVGGVSSPQMLTTNDVTVAGVSLGLNGSLFPGNQVSITVRSNDNGNINVLEVESYIPPVQR